MFPLFIGLYFNWGYGSFYLYDSLLSFVGEILRYPYSVCRYIFMMMNKLYQEEIIDCRKREDAALLLCGYKRANVNHQTADQKLQHHT